MKKEELVKNIIDANKEQFPWLFSDPRYKQEYVEKWVDIVFFNKIQESKEKYENDVEQCCAMIVSSYKVELKYG